MKSRERSVLARFLSAAALVLFTAFTGHAAYAQPAGEIYRRPLEVTPLDRIDVTPNGCKTDADCTTDLDGDLCTKPKCLGIPALGKDVCTETPLYPAGSSEEKCCKAGIYETNPEWACCAKGDSKGCDDGNPCTDDTCGSLIAVDAKMPVTGLPQCLHNPNDRCNGCPECPRCPPIPKIDCDVVGDPKMKSCCEEKGGLLWFVMAGCIEKGPGAKEGCTNWAEHVTNSGVFQQCCLINYGVIEGDINMCNNVTGGGPTPTGGTPTTPSGSADALTCSVAQVGEPVEGKYEIDYTVPSSAGPVVSATLTQVSGSQIRVEGEAEPADFGATVTAPKSMSTKSISDANNPPTFTVYAPTPKSMAGEWKAPFEVQVSLNTLEGGAGTATCTEMHFLHSEGACGCDMTARLSPREQILAYLVMALIFAVPMIVLRSVRKKI
ncbi:MAG TPA: hypothetical protein VLJ37_00150 [bacterium]|nr:hypothetical protein [bacterium]